MRGTPIRRSSSVLLVTMLLVGAAHSLARPALAMVVHTDARAVETASFDELIARAEQERAAGDHMTSARSYAAAYRTLAGDDRIGLMGEITVDNALTDYRLAHEEHPEDLALLTEPLALLEGFVMARGNAHGEGEEDVVPARMLAERERLRVMLDQSRPVPEPQETVVPAAKVVAEAARQPVERVSSEPRPHSSSEARADGEQERLGVNQRSSTAILGVGVTAIIAGTALATSGVWRFDRVDSRSEVQLAVLEVGNFTESAREDYRARLDDWQQRWRGTATGLVVAGSVLAAAGIGLTTWGLVRMQRNGGRTRQQATHRRPVVWRGSLGVGLAF